MFKRIGRFFVTDLCEFMVFIYFFHSDPQNNHSLNIKLMNLINFLLLRNRRILNLYYGNTLCCVVNDTRDNIGNLLFIADIKRRSFDLK